MKYHIEIPQLKKKFSDFTTILSELIDQDIEIQIIFPQITQRSQSLIKQLEDKKFLNLSKLQTIPLNQFATILQRDKELEYELKQFIVQKLSLETQIHWFIQEKNLITDINCKNIVEEFLNKLFYISTVYEEYASFISSFPNIKTLKISELTQINSERPLKGYRGKNQPQNYEEKEYYIIYGYKHNDYKNIFQKKIVQQEYQVSMFNIFTQYYIPLMKPLISKYYYTLIDVREGTEIIDLVGPHHLLKEAAEIIMKEFKSIQKVCGPIRTNGLNKEFIDRYGTSEFLQAKKIVPYEISKQSSQFQEELEKALQPIKSQTFQAVLFAEFKQEQLQDISYYFNFEFQRDEIEQQLQQEAEKIAKTNCNGLCVCYFSVVFGTLLSSELKKQLYDIYNLESEEVYNHNLIQYLYSLPFEYLQCYEDQHKILLDISEKKCIVTGKKEGIQKFQECLRNVLNEKNDVIDFFQFKSLFYIKSAMIDFKEKYELLIQQSECHVDAQMTSTRIKITGKQNNITKLVSQLKDLEQNIDNQKIIKQISVEVPSTNVINQTIKQLQQDYPSIEVILGECDQVNLTLVYQFKRKQTRIRLCNGSPTGLLDIREEIIKLNKTIFLIPVEKIHTNILKPVQIWENEITQKRPIDMISFYESKAYKLYKYQITLPLMQQEQNEIVNNNKQKNNQKKNYNNNPRYQIKPEISEYQICHLYYRDYKKPENFIHYFDKEILEASLSQFMQEFESLQPMQIMISCTDGDINKFQQLIAYVHEQQFPKLTLTFLLNSQEHIDAIKEKLLKDFDEEQIQKQNIVQHFSIVGCVKDDIEKLIQKLHQI